MKYAGNAYTPTTTNGCEETHSLKVIVFHLRYHENRIKWVFFHYISHVIENKFKTSIWNIHMILLNDISLKSKIFIMELKLILKEKVWPPNALLVKAAIAVIRHHYQSNLRKKEFDFLRLLRHSPPQKEVRTGTQTGNLEAGMKHRLWRNMAYSWLAQPSFLYHPVHLLRGDMPPHWDGHLHPSLIKTIKKP